MMPAPATTTRSRLAARASGLIAAAASSRMKERRSSSCAITPSAAGVHRPHGRPEAAPCRGDGEKESRRADDCGVHRPERESAHLFEQATQAPDRQVAEEQRRVIEADGDTLNLRWSRAGEV